MQRMAPGTSRWTKTSVAQMSPPHEPQQLAADSAAPPPADESVCTPSVLLPPTETKTDLVAEASPGSPDSTTRSPLCLPRRVWQRLWVNLRPDKPDDRATQEPQTALQPLKPRPRQRLPRSAERVVRHSVLLTTDNAGNVTEATSNAKTLFGPEVATQGNGKALTWWFAQWPHVREKIEAATEGEPVRFAVDDVDGRIWCVACQPDPWSQPASGAVAVWAQPCLEKSALVAELLQENKMLQREVRAQYRDRSLIAYEIHDTVAQDVLAAQMAVDEILSRDELMAQAASVPAVVQGLLRSRRLVARALHTARDLMQGIQPVELQRRGLRRAVEELIAETAAEGIQTELHWDLNADTFGDKGLERVVFRIIQEAMTNVWRHSGAKTASVHLRRTAGTLVIEIHDSGRGFTDSEVGESSYGLRGMRIRAAMLKGRLHVHSEPDAGTRVRVEIPYPQA